MRKINKSKTKREQGRGEKIDLIQYKMTTFKPHYTFKSENIVNLTYRTISLTYFSFLFSVLRPLKVPPKRMILNG